MKVLIVYSGDREILRHGFEDEDIRIDIVDAVKEIRNELDEVVGYEDRVNRQCVEGKPQFN